MYNYACGNSVRYYFLSKQDSGLYFRYGGNCVKTTGKCDKMLRDKNLWYFIAENNPKVLLSCTKAEKKKHQNFNFAICLPFPNSITLEHT